MNDANDSEQVHSAPSPTAPRVDVKKKMGNPSVHLAASLESRARGGAAMAARAKAFAEGVRPAFAELENLSATAAARRLTKRGIQTPRGGKWSATQVIAVRARLKT